MGWFSMGIRLVFITTLCFLWLNQDNVNASGQSAPIEKPKIPTKPKDITGALAYHILEKLYVDRHEPFLKELGKLLGNNDLSNNEVQLGADFIKAFKSKDSMRRYLIEYIMNEMSFQTIAVGVHKNSKTVVIAGNIKAFDFWNLAGEVRTKQLRITRVAITDVGFRPSDYKIIQDILAKEYPNYKIVVVQPSDKDLGDAVKDLQDAKGVDRKTLVLREQAQAFHAEMQVRKYFEHNGGIGGEHDITIVASKQYCVNCWNNLVEKEIRVADLEGKKYSAPNMRWKEPDELTVVHSGELQDHTEVDPHISETSRVVEMLESSGGACSSRPVCRSLEDFDQVGAEEFNSQIRKLPQQDRESLLYALEKIGRDKLAGSTSTKDGIHKIWKRWKISIAVGVIEALRTGTIVHGFLRGGSKTFEPERTAISPSIITESLNHLQETEIESISEEHERYRNGQLVEGRKSLRASEIAHKVVKTVNLAMFGKNLMGTALEGDTTAMIEMAGLFVADRALGKAGDMIVLKGTALAEAGEKAVGTAWKIAGPIMGSATIGLTIYGLVSEINGLKYLDKVCQENHTLMEDGMKTDCRFDHDIAIANVVAEGVGTIVGVASVVDGVLAALTVSTGPAGIIFAAIDVLISIATQIFKAVQTVAKIDSLIIGGLTGWEKLDIGFNAFFQMSLPPDIKHLLDIKKGYNIDVNLSEQLLKKMDKFQTYVAPTTHTRSNIKVECDCTGYINPFKAIECDLAPEKHGVCKLTREFENNNNANFQQKQQVHRFRVEPDTPDWGTLECKPNSPTDKSYENDPPYVGTTEGFLCQNVIAHSAPSRPDLPVLVDLKNGNDYVTGFPDRKHVFLAEAGNKNFTGGSADDFFIIRSGDTYGEFNGAGGTNTLLLDNDKEPFKTKRYVLEGKDVCKVYTPMYICFPLTNVQQVVGRRNKEDTVVTASSTTYVDLKGGESASKPDKIVIPAMAVNLNPTTVLQLRQFTTVEYNHHGRGSFIYNIEFGPGILFDFKQSPGLMHQFVFSNDILYANITLSYEFYVGSIITIANKNEGKEITLKNVRIQQPGVTLMTEGGYALSYDQAAETIFGIVVLSSGKGEKQEDVVGFLNVPNHFILNTSNPLNIKGGDKDDTFILAGNNTLQGEIQGNGGVNSVLIQQDYNPTQVIAIDFESKTIRLCAKNPEGLSFGHCEEPVQSSVSLSMSNIENVIGRPSLPEEIKVNCDVKLLNLRGGLQGASDIIRIPTELSSCKPEMTLMISDFTTVKNLASDGIFTYQIDMKEASQTISIEVNMHGNATHNYIFNKEPTALTDIKFNPKTKEFQIQFQQGSWSGVVPLERSTFYLANQVGLEVVPEVRGVVHVDSSTTRSVNGLPAHPNIFVLGDTMSRLSVYGGGKDDTFFVTSDKFSIAIQGNDGSNTVVLADGICEGSAIIIDGIDKTVSVKTGPAAQFLFFILNIQRLFGRAGQSDLVYPGCDTTLIDTRGGSNTTNYDLVHVSSRLNCDYDLDVAIRPNLIVINDAREGEFRYAGDFRGGNTSIFLTFSQNADHDVYLAMDFPQLEKLHLSTKEGRVHMTAPDKSEFSIDFFVPLGEHTHTQPSIVFQDGLQLKIIRHGGYSSTVFGVLRNVKPSDIAELDKNIGESKLIQKYQKTAKDFRTNVVMEVRTGTLVSIGSGGKFEVLTAVPGYKENILVCNDAAETVYRIANGTSKVQIVSHLFNVRHKVLDLTPIAKVYPGVVPSSIQRVSDCDYVILIRDTEITIKLAPGRSSDLKKWKVLLRETYLNMEWRVDRIALVPKPIVVDPKKQDTVVLNTVNLEHSTEILTSHDADPIVYEPMRQGNNLVFTNLFRNDTSKEVATVIFSGYYNKGVREGLTNKNVAFENEPGDFFILGKSKDNDLPTLEQRISEDSGFQEVRMETHVKDEL